MKKPTSLRDRAAQLLMPRLGSNMPPAVAAEDDVDRVADFLADIPVGGLVMFRGSAAHTPAGLARLQRASSFPLLIGSDLERGAGQQIAGATVFPHAMAFGAAEGAVHKVQQAARVTASEARAAGVHWLFAPVADVHSNPQNPIISTRAFGHNPDHASEMVAAFIRGCREGGALSTAKHFPGHGDTDTDSHDVVPRVSRSRPELEALELAPFKAAIRAGVDAMMTAHVAYPALDATESPATWSPAILRTLLRDQMGFDGIVISDSLLMGGAGESVSARAPELVAAGIDVLLDISHPLVAVNALVDAVESGRLREDTLDQAFERIWRAKTTVFSTTPEPINVDGHALTNEVAAAALQEAGDLFSALAGAGNVPLLVVRPHLDYPDPTRADTLSIFRDASPRLEVELFGPHTSPETQEAWLARAREAGRAVLAMVVKPAAWHKFGLLPQQAEFARRLIGAVPTVICNLGSPDATKDLPQPAAQLTTYSDVESSVRVVATRIKSVLDG